MHLLLIFSQGNINVGNAGKHFQLFHSALPEFNQRNGNLMYQDKTGGGAYQKVWQLRWEQAVHFYSLLNCVVLVSLSSSQENASPDHLLSVICVLKCSLTPPLSYITDIVQELKWLYHSITCFQVHTDSSTISADLDFRFKVTFCHWLMSAYTNTVVELKTQLPHCYLCSSQYTIFSSSREEVSLCSRL